MQTAFLIAFLSEMLISACHLPSLSHPRDLDQVDCCSIEEQLFCREYDLLLHAASTLLPVYSPVSWESAACADVVGLQVKSQIWLSD